MSEPTDKRAPDTLRTVPGPSPLPDDSVEVRRMWGLRRFADGAWLSSYDPDWHPEPWDGLQTGLADFTANPQDAMVFETAREAFDCWVQRSTVLPTRPQDGRPNKPLTAYTVSVEELP